MQPRRRRRHARDRGLTAHRGPRGRQPARAARRTLAIESLSLSEHAPLDAKIARGRELFHTSNDSRISNDGRACATCHVDGREDSLVWASPDGKRQTPMLAGRLSGTSPFGWSGSMKSLREHVGQTLSRLEGKGLPDADMQALRDLFISNVGCRLDELSVHNGGTMGTA